MPASKLLDYLTQQEKKKEPVDTKVNDNNINGNQLSKL